MAVGNQQNREAGRPTLHELDCRKVGLKLRDKLKHDLHDYDLHRRTTYDWKDDKYSHIVRT